MSDGYFTFEGRVETMVWGKSTYTILPLPHDVVETLLAMGAKRVEGEINDHPVNLALTRAPVRDEVFLWAGQSLLDRVSIVPGQQVEMRLRPVSNDQVDLPEDLQAALGAADLNRNWHALTPGKRRSLLYQIDSAKTAPTRAKRIARLVADLAGETK
jgi:Bacteriocin-protection, YdeI or OmpD-Associated/Domain of unknown function (DUF1905)